MHTWTWTDGSVITRIAPSPRAEYMIVVPGESVPHYARTLENAITIMNDIIRRLVTK